MMLYRRSTETCLHALWECGLQKFGTYQEDLPKLVEKLLDRLSIDDCELFTVQASTMWHKQNGVVYGGHWPTSCLGHIIGNIQSLLLTYRIHLDTYTNHI